MLYWWLSNSITACIYIYIFIYIYIYIYIYIFIHIISMAIYGKHNFLMLNIIFVYQFEYQLPNKSIILKWILNVALSKTNNNLEGRLLNLSINFFEISPFMCILQNKCLLWKDKKMYFAKTIYWWLDFSDLTDLVP